MRRAFTRDGGDEPTSSSNNNRRREHAHETRELTRLRARTRDGAGVAGFPSRPPARPWLPGTWSRSRSCRSSTCSRSRPARPSRRSSRTSSSRSASRASSRWPSGCRAFTRYGNISFLLLVSPSPHSRGRGGGARRESDERREAARRRTASRGGRSGGRGARRQQQWQRRGWRRQQRQPRARATEQASIVKLTGAVPIPRRAGQNGVRQRSAAQ